MTQALVDRRPVSLSPSRGLLSKQGGEGRGRGLLIEQPMLTEQGGA